MLYRRQGFPEESELVLCTVSNVKYDSVFVKLNEYDKLGVIHISEISPGRIRNIRDFVREGKVIVCKVLRINKERGHIDLSLRRVTDMQRREKANAIKQEQKAEAILESVARKQKKDVKKFYKEISAPILKRYEYILQCFEDIVENNIKLEDLGIDKKLASDITKIVKEKIKPKEVRIKGILKVEVYDNKGIENVKEGLKKGLNDNLDIKYGGGGSYNVSVKAKDYKKAEAILKESIEAITSFFEKKEGKVNFERKELK